MPRGRRHRTGPAGRTREAGFSLVEVMIAGLILLIISLGIIPLYVRSVSLNQEGRSATVVTSIASSEIERLMNVSFNGPDLTVPPGQTELVVEEFQAEPRGEWVDVDDWTEDSFSFHRIIRVRQFPLGALTYEPTTAPDYVLEESEALDGGSSAIQIQLKEIVVQVESGAFAGGGAKQVTLRALRGV